MYDCFVLAFTDGVDLIANSEYQVGFLARDR